ncbi:BolA family transcriptional regulator [Leptospira perolatii]|uniref:BolA family transcriptional regulator n=1 Tax=Leptospira perolatii TaxID=2023191 RepID=A0A2M9ZJL3_9LEPT|nr:BolA/IbaG family iron-sulfur metabolism protein [Leptospira perolatii]PJZ68567.1 BolA family transcriptional regulator [Leptospira perolatii]PJZ72222.1 BolA family transcriptional regulator [Leptospira perolatii]
MTIEQIRQKIAAGLPGADVTILDPYHDGVHIKAVVKYEGFAGKSILEQHRMVYSTLEEELKEEVHALALETRAS